MREFGKGGFSLGAAPRPVRLVYGGFLLLAVIGLATEVGFVVGRIGVAPHAVARYYRGGEAGDVMTFPKTAGQLLEVTHAHAFVMGLVFLVVAHLFLSTAAPAPLKTAVLVVTFTGTVGDLLAPWLIRYAAARWAWLAVASWVAQGLGYAILVVVTVGECLALGSRGRMARPSP